MSRRPSRPALVVATLALGGTVVSMQQSLILPILPDLPALLGTTASDASWLVTATLLAGAVAIPTVSRLADMFGKRRMILVALGVTLAGSVMAALGDAVALVIAGRTLQGVGLAVLPIGIAVLRDELPADRLPLGVAMMSTTLAIGTTAALPLAGIIASRYGWHAIFWVTAIACVVSLVGVARSVPESPLRPGGSFDVVGAVLFSAAMTSLLLALSKAAQWGTGPALALSGLGLVLLLVWGRVELRRPSPLVDIRVAARPAVLLVNIASVLVGFAMFTNMVGTTQFLQQGDAGYGPGLDTFQAGLWMTPTAVVFGMCAPVCASLIRWFGAQLTLVGGAAVMAVAYAARVFLHQHLWQVVAASIVVGIGTAMAFAALPNLIMAAVPATETASANGLTMLLRAVGTSTASAAMAALTTGLMVSVGGRTYPGLAAFTTAFWVAAGASAAAGIVIIPLLRQRRVGLRGPAVPPT